MKRIVFILFLLWNTSAALAESVFNLRGTIGNLPVYLQLEEFTSNENPNVTIADGTYFYEKQLKDIVLRGTKNGNAYSLFLNRDGKNFDERIVVNASGAGKFVGTWTSKSGKSLPVSLELLDVSKINNPYKNYDFVRNLDPFEYARTAFFKLKRDSVTSKKGKSFVWFSETHCEAALFRLGNGFSKQTLELINPRLDSIHFQQIFEQLTCASYENVSSGSNIYYQTDISYLSEDLLGFSIFSAYDCGGAHPDQGSQGYLVDLHSGKFYDLEDAYNISAASLLKLENSIHQFKKPKSDDECDYTDAEIWKYPSWNFTEKGIEFTPIFPRFMRACEEDFLIPFSALKPFRKASFPYSF